jgi:DNA-binding Lrp family transcriptional regulator
MLADGRIRRIGVVPNHYRLGYSANGMSVWDVPDEDMQATGTQVGELDIVSHCYHRPRCMPDWPYNLFAMVHGHSQAEVRDKVNQIAQLLGGKVRHHDVLFSTRILKKTGLRIGGQ